MSPKLSKRMKMNKVPGEEKQGKKGLKEFYFQSEEAGLFVSSSTVVLFGGLQIAHKLRTSEC